MEALGASLVSCVSCRRARGQRAGCSQSGSICSMSLCLAHLRSYAACSLSQSRPGPPRSSPSQASSRKARSAVMGASSTSTRSKWSILTPSLHAAGRGSTCSAGKSSSRRFAPRRREGNLVQACGKPCHAYFKTALRSTIQGAHRSGRLSMAGLHCTRCRRIRMPEVLPCCRSFSCARHVDEAPRMQSVLYAA